jgi:hypothetical protein
VRGPPALWPRRWHERRGARGSASAAVPLSRLCPAPRRRRAGCAPASRARRSALTLRTWKLRGCVRITEGSAGPVPARYALPRELLSEALIGQARARAACADPLGPAARTHFRCDGNDQPTTTCRFAHSTQAELIWVRLRQKGGTAVYAKTRDEKVMTPRGERRDAERTRERRASGGRGE